MSVSMTGRLPAAAVPRFQGVFYSRDTMEQHGAFELHRFNVIQGRGQKGYNAYKAAAESLSPDYKDLGLTANIDVKYSDGPYPLEGYDNGDTLLIRHQEWSKPLELERRTSFWANLMSQVLLGSTTFRETPMEFLVRGLMAAKDKLGPGGAPA